ncbi:MAG: leucine-rich repeat protein [Oscillospiraceae bacterium]|nr:leucine-rich repeat protein [Oscillospiraceae bacterium]
MRFTRTIAALSAACLMLSGGGAAFTPLTGSAVCAATEAATGVVDGLKYTTENGYGMITGYTDELPENVMIPEQVGGKDVVRIDSEAFANCKKLRSVIMPETVKEIGFACFRDCVNLEEITFPTEIADFGQYAIQGTKWLADRQANNPLVTASNVVVDGTGCTGAVTIPEEITIIGIQAFKNNTKLTGITLPESLGCIESWAFKGCTGLKEVTLPGTLDSFIESGCFENCTGLESVVLGDGIRKIEDDVFSGCTALKSVSFPSTMVRIGSSFSECSALKEVTIPASVKLVDPEAFTDCENLETVTVEGYYTYLSDQDWNAVAFSNSGHWADDFTFTGKLRGLEGSLAQEYAEHFNISFEPAGEVPTSGECGGGLKWALTGDTLTISENGKMDDYTGLVKVNGEITGSSYQDVAPWFMHRDRIKNVVVGPAVIDIAPGALADMTAMESVTFENPNCRIPTGRFTISNGVNEAGRRYYSGVIRGYDGSSAQGYADQYDIPFETLGESPILIMTTAPDPMTMPGTTFCGGDCDITTPAQTTVIPGVTTTAAAKTTKPYTKATSIAKVSVGTKTTATTAKTPDSAEETGTTFVTTGTDVLTDDKLYGKCGENATFSYHIVYGELSFDGEGDIADYDVSKGKPAPWYYEDGFGAFGNYSFPNTLRFGDGITGIGSDAFYGCDRLESVAVPEHVSRIGANAFCSCTGLNRIEIRDPECKIADTDRTICSGIKDGRAYFNGTIAGYKDSTAQKYAQKYGYQFEALAAETAATTAVTRTEKQTTATTAATTRITGVTTTTAASTATDIPGVTTTETVVTTHFPDDTFRGQCGEHATWAYNFVLQNLEIEGSGDMDDYDINKEETAPWFEYAITGDPYFNRSIRTIFVNDSITGIGAGAFFSCASVENIVLPESVGRIGENTFYLCGALKRIVIMNPECDIADTEWTISSGIRANRAFFNGTIAGFEGSTAQKYAQKYGYRFEPLTVEPESKEPVNGMQISLKLVPYLKTDGYTAAEQAEYQKQADEFMKKVAQINVTGDLFRVNEADPENYEPYRNVTDTLKDNAAEIAALSAYDSAPLSCRVQTYWEYYEVNGKAEAVFEFLDASGNVLMYVNANPVAFVVRDGVTTYYDKFMSVLDLSKALSDSPAERASALRLLKGKTVSGQYALADYDCETALGDTDGDNDVSVIDAQLALKAYTEGLSGKPNGLTQAQVQATDINRDGKVSVEDVQLILKYYTENTVAGKTVTWAQLRNA